MNRARIARENAGLSIGQAVRMLSVDDDITRHIDSDALIRIEESDSAFVDWGAEHRLAHLYRVRVEWLRGDVPQHDYSVLDGVRGVDDLTSHDRDTIAEFAASMPRMKAT